MMQHALLQEVGKKNHSLKHLSFGHVRIDGEQFKQFILANNVQKTVEALSFKEAMVYRGKEQEAFCEGLAANENIKRIHFENTFVDTENLVASISNSTFEEISLKTISIHYRNNDNADASLGLLGAMLALNPHVKKLDLTMGHFSILAMKEFMDDLGKNPSSLTHLNLSRNSYVYKDKYPSSDGVPLIESLQKTLQTNHTLKCLDLEGVYLGPKCGNLFADILCQNHSLVELSIEETQIDLEGAKKILRSLENNFTLTALNLAKNKLNIDREFVDILEGLVLKNPTLKRIDLPGNQIKPFSDEARKLFELSKKRGIDFRLDFEYLLNKEYHDEKEAHSNIDWI